MTNPFAITDRVKTHGLVICRFVGTLSAESLQPLIAQIESLEAKYPQGFGRFSDLSKIEGLTLSANEIKEFASRRERTYRGPAVQSALYSPDALTYGMMRIYAAVMFPTLISVGVFYELLEAALWLDVPVEHLDMTE